MVKFVNKVHKWNVSILARLMIRTVNDKFDFNIALTGLRGCLTEDTLIHTPLGNRPISKIKDYDFLYAYDFKTNKPVEVFAKKIDSGIKEVYEIETEDGRKINATMNHIFYVKRNNKIIELPLEKIKKGDLLITLK